MTDVPYSKCCRKPVESESWYDYCAWCKNVCKIDSFYTKEELLLLRLQDLYEMPDATMEEITEEAERRQEVLTSENKKKLWIQK